MNQLKSRQKTNEPILRRTHESQKSYSLNINSVDELKSQIRLNGKNSQKSKISKVPKSNKSKRKILFSLCIIVKNEEKMLRDCLKSVDGLVDEIILVDTGSSDKTKEIAKEFGAKIFDFPWINDFAAARNESLKHATGEWILYLDADERVAPMNNKKLRNILQKADPKLGALLCTIESIHYADDDNQALHRGAYPRLFRNLGYPKINFTGRVHEQISPSIRDAGLGMLGSDIVIKHEGYNTTKDVMESKIKRNYKLLIDHVNEEPTNAYAWYQLGQTLAQMKLNKEAEEAILFAVECGNLSDSVYASAANSLSKMSGSRRDFEKALWWSEESLGKAPEQVYGMTLKANSLLQLKRGKESVICFEKALSVLADRKGIPQSGFDIMLSESSIREGLEKARKLL
jgi:glycosyltransferase involved in cell wall biosynthesis